MDNQFQKDLVELLPRLRRFARGLCGDWDLADDLVQQACERALKKQHQWQAGTRLDSWMYRIIQNLHIDKIRRDKNLQSAPAEAEVLDIEDFRTRNEHETRDMVSKVTQVIDSLPDDQKTVMLLVAIEGHSYREVAELLKIPMGTVMSRLYRARTRILSLIGQAPVICAESN